MKKSDLITLIKECVKEVIKEKSGRLQEAVKPYSSLKEYNKDLDKMIVLAKQLIKK